MEKFAPCLWFDQNAEEAVAFYTSLFENSHVDAVSHYLDGAPMPKGTVLTIRFTLAGQELDALNGGPVFHFTPAVSLFVTCRGAAEFDALWEKLSGGGTVMMEAGPYGFSEKFGWLADRYGLSWQLSVGEAKQKITPYLLFTGAQYPRAEEAAHFYGDVFGQGNIDFMQKYEAGNPAGEKEGAVMFAQFSLHGQAFMAADSGYDHKFAFTEANSFLVYCEGQAEIDRLWAKLTADGGEEQPCGWLKDKFGVSWQIVTRDMERLTSDAEPERAKRAMNAMFQMKKLDIAALQATYDG